MTKNDCANALIIHDGSNSALVKSAKNLKNVKTLNGNAVNVYDILHFDYILVEDKIFESKILGATL